MSKNNTRTFLGSRDEEQSKLSQTLIQPKLLLTQ